MLSPAKTFVKIVLILLAMLVWLDNLGFDVGTLLAGLGVGGIAFALAAQDTIKNLIGSVMVILDKPYQVGQRIVVKGHDGVVEEGEQGVVVAGDVLVRVERGGQRLCLVEVAHVWVGRQETAEDGGARPADAEKIELHPQN